MIVFNEFRANIYLFIAYIKYDCKPKKTLFLNKPIHLSVPPEQFQSFSSNFLLCEHCPFYCLVF